MTFDIRFVSEPVVDDESRGTARVGRIQLRDYWEDFTALLGHWRSEDYEKQWREGIALLVTTHRPSCVVTSVHDRQKSDLVRWWLLFPQGERVVVQESMLVRSQLSKPFDERNPYASIPEYRATNEEGDEISSWEVPWADFESFLDR